MENVSDMPVFTIPSKTAGPRLLISAGVHGDEFEPMIAAWKLIQQTPSILKAGAVTIVPRVNISACMLGTRTGADQLDLARSCPGNLHGTVTEMNAAQISALIEQVDYFIDLHTGGKMFDIYPLAGYMMHPSAEILNEQRAMAKAFNFPVIWGTDVSPNGRTLSVARDANVPAIYIEFGGGDCVRSEIIEAVIQGCVNVMKSLKMTEAPPALNSQFKWQIEDNAPNNGYLQGMMPAPSKGIFISKVNPGEKVKKGQLWGVLFDSATGSQQDIRADKNGLVLFVRRSALVVEGDSLGGILPVGDRKPDKE
ncbi:MAG: succinylglutamate desuccinylase/aspartoacylase family protein [Chitinophagaceae bacterium]|nr:succinylglutamate desuccinylase/aspartoacylase family protein [Chitinophagaceae bacterium]